MNLSTIITRQLALATAVGIALAATAQEQTTPTPADQAYQQAVDSIQTDLELELEKLAKVRKKITAEKPAIAKQAAESALKLRQKKREYEVAKATQASVDHQLQERQKKLKLWRDERVYFDGLLSDFTKNYRSIMPVAEAAPIEQLFKDSAIGGDDGTAAGVELVEQMTARLSSLGQVQVVPGKALSPDGVMTEGQFAIAGPLSWFAADQGDIGGLIRESRSLQPEVIEGIGELAAIRALVAGQPGDVSFDPTMGSAIAITEVDGGIGSYIRKGGVWIYPILVLALVALAAAIAKWIQLLGIRQVRPSMLQEIIDLVNQNEEAATALASGKAEKISHPARSVILRGIESAKKPIEAVEESMYQAYLEVQPRLQRGLMLIAIASATSPLLGLLGTVTGMIKTFNRITIFGTGDPKTLSGGISEALITTAWGLIVAIPALILHALLSRKVQGIRASIEMVSLAFINGLKGAQEK